MPKQCYVCDFKVVKAALKYALHKQYKNDAPSRERVEKTVEELTPDVAANWVSELLGNVRCTRRTK